MALTAGTPWGHTVRPWGYEVRVDFTDADTGRIYNEVMTFPSEPVQASIDAEVLVAKAKAELVAYPPAQYEITNNDGMVTTI